MFLNVIFCGVLSLPHVDQCRGFAAEKIPCGRSPVAILAQALVLQGAEEKCAWFGDLRDGACGYGLKVCARHDLVRVLILSWYTMTGGG